MLQTGDIVITQYDPIKTNIRLILILRQDDIQYAYCLFDNRLDTTRSKIFNSDMVIEYND